ncbi:hypothetical protein F5Y17DRAFT_384075 [Xylariaceae sp. FL0594]|nr:hypothetical protein F5Y17DRAFT_384075 [Xylariaceae sp. FL0594]
MGSSNRPAEGWASANDWALHRPLITALYQDQNKTLKETMRVMEEKHGFFATVRMYKARFQQWGIEKKIKAGDAVEIFRQQTVRAKAGKPSVAYIRGRKITPDRLQRYRYRAAAIVSEQILLVERELANAPSSEVVPASSNVVCRTPSPSPPPEVAPPTLSPRLDDPTELKVPLECMRILESYVAGSITSGAWMPPTDAQVQPIPDAFTWTHYLAMSQGLIAHNRTREGFALLSICFEEYKSHLRNPDPFFWLATYKAALVLAYRDPKLGDAFVNYASKLTAVVLPREHPFNRVWSRIMVTGLPGLQQHAGALIEAYLNTWKDQAGLIPPDQTALVHMVFVLIQLQSSGLLSHSFTKKTMGDMLAALTQPLSYQFLLQEAKFRQACLLLENGELDSAGIVTGEIISWLDSLSEADSNEHCHLRCKCLWTLFEIRDKKGLVKEATQTGFALVKVCHEIYGPVHLQTLDAISALESFLQRNNDTATAQRVTRQFDKRWAVFHNKAQLKNGFPHVIEQPWLYRAIELREDKGLIQQVVDMMERSSWLSD